MTHYSETALYALIRLAFEAPAYAVLRNVADGTGSSQNRWADAIAMGVWPSRGLDLHGFEIKSDRRDWIRELKNPAKAEPIARYCDRWWLVVGDADMVKDGELPETWGLLAPNKSGEKLVRVKEAPKLEAAPITRRFLAALLRRVNEQAPEAEALAAERKRGYDDGFMSGEASAQRDNQWAGRDLKSLQESVAAFERASGIAIGSYDGERIGTAARILGEILNDRRQLDYPLANVRRILGELGTHLDMLSAAVNEIGPRKESTDAA